MSKILIKEESKTLSFRPDETNIIAILPDSEEKQRKALLRETSIPSSGIDFLLLHGKYGMNKDYTTIVYKIVDVEDWRNV